MPRKQQRVARNEDKAVQMRTPFRLAINNSKTTTGISWVETDLTCANLAGRIADMSYDFEYFRATHLKAYSSATLDGNGVAAPTYLLHGVAFDITPAAFVITPTSLNRFVGFKHAKIGAQYAQPTITVNAAELRRDRPQRWYHTQATGSPDASESSIGTLYQYLELGCSGTLAIAANSFTILEGIIEFAEPVDPTLSRARRAAASGDLIIPRVVRDDPVNKSLVGKLERILEDSTPEDGPGVTKGIAPVGRA